MSDPFQKFKFLVPTSITINGRDAVIKAEVYQSSKEQRILTQGGNEALLRFYTITYAGEEAPQLLNEVEVIELIGYTNFL